MQTKLQKYISSLILYTGIISTISHYHNGIAFMAILRTLTHASSLLYWQYCGDTKRTYIISSETLVAPG